MRGCWGVEGVNMKTRLAAIAAVTAVLLGGGLFAAAAAAANSTTATTVFDGATIMFGGFGEAGSPIELIHALIDQGATNLTMISNNCGSGQVGLAGLHDRARREVLSGRHPASRAAQTAVESKARRSGGDCRDRPGRRG